MAKATGLSPELMATITLHLHAREDDAACREDKDRYERCERMRKEWFAFAGMDFAEAVSINPARLPTLADLHALNLNITGGMDAADYVDKMRGDD